MSATLNARGELAVLVACHTFLVAIPTRTVVRLFMDEEVTSLRAEKHGALLGTVRAAGKACAAWDLGVLLDLEPLTRSWVVVDVEHGGARVPIALRTGACAFVTQVRPEASLPGRIFRARGRAFPAAFAASSLGAEVPALFGLWLDVARLFTDDELAASIAVIGRGEHASVKP